MSVVNHLPVDVDPADLEHVARCVAVLAGRLIVDERPVDLDVAQTKSSRTDIVTEMDSRSEQLLRAELARLRPDDGVLGEEGTSHAGSSGITWVVDPIDGTVNYLYEIPAYAVSVAACVGDLADPERLVPVAGAVFNPVTRELFHAYAGGGARLSVGEHERRLEVSAQTDPALALLGTGFGYDSAKRARQAALLTDVISRVRDVRRIGSAALDLCSTAAGRLDVYYESGLNPWDRAAGQLIVAEAGGVVRGVDAEPTSDLVVAGPQVLVEQLAAWVLPARTWIDPAREA